MRSREPDINVHPTSMIYREKFDRDVTSLSRATEILRYLEKFVAIHCFALYIATSACRRLRLIADFNFPILHTSLRQINSMRDKA